MLYDAHRRIATPGTRSSCPSCGGELVAKCGPIVSWHWAHHANDCDPWSEPESDWHLHWKQHLESLGGRVEVVMGDHRADVVMPNGSIVELQSNYLAVGDIAAREAFYGPTLRWIYRCHWVDRIHWGARGFWWKQGSKAMATHQRPVWWHVDDGLHRVRLNVVTAADYTQRVVGRVVDTRFAGIAA